MLLSMIHSSNQLQSDGNPVARRVVSQSKATQKKIIKMKRAKLGDTSLCRLRSCGWMDKRTDHQGHNIDD